MANIYPLTCGFHKAYSTQHSSIVMLEKWRKALDNGKLACALHTALSKAFDCFNHELLIARLHVFGFDHRSLTYIYSYLTGRLQMTRINNCFSTWAEIISGIAQGSILGPFLFNIYINDIFVFVKENELTNYAGGNTPYFINIGIGALIGKLENDSSMRTKWFADTYLVMSADKSKLLVTRNVENVSLIVDNQIIHGSKTVKLLGIRIDNRLVSTEHISNICNNVSMKLHALARISNYISQQKLRMLLKVFIESPFSYCLLVWMFHSRRLNNRLNKLHERAPRLVYKNPTLTFKQLLEKDNSFTIHQRNIQKLAIEIYKVINNESPSIMDNIFPPTSNQYNLRNKNTFRSFNVHSVHHGTKSITYR